MEREDLICPGGFRFFYDDALFPPGTDSFLLSSLPVLKPGLRVCDLGCGTALLALLLLTREKSLRVTGVELEPQAVRLAQKAVAKNDLAEQLDIRQGDLRAVSQLFASGSFDLVVCNPPYYPVNSGRQAAGEAMRRARAELTCTLEEVCHAAAYLLRWGGSFSLVHKPQRLADVICALRESGLEAKRLRLVCPREGAAPSLVLLEGRRGGRPGLQIEPPLVLQTSQGLPTPELDRIYFRQKEDMP